MNYSFPVLTNCRLPWCSLILTLYYFQYSWKQIYLRDSNLYTCFQEHLKKFISEVQTAEKHSVLQCIIKPEVFPGKGNKNPLLLRRLSQCCSVQQLFWCYYTWRMGTCRTGLAIFLNVQCSVFGSSNRSESLKKY